MPDIERVGELACAVGESPIWSAGEQAWYWVDITARRVWRLDASSGALRSWSTPEMVACIAVKQSGGLVAGLETGIFALELGEGEAVTAQLLAGCADLGPGMRFNDGGVDRQGRFWSGTMFMDMSACKAIGQLYRFTGAEGLSAPVVSELVTQNGLAWSPDGRTMYLSDSHPSRQLVWAFDYDTDTGTPHNRRLFVDMNSLPGRPDGATVDADGCYWSAGNDGSVLLRFTPEGKLDRTIELPFAKPSMCCFGGKDLDTMLVTSINPGSNPDDKVAGGVVLVKPGVKGLAAALVVA